MPRYMPVLATLGYLLSPDTERVLLIYRNKRPEDLAFGKYNGLGGKMESHEDALTCMRRELMEEAGVVATSVLLRGTINWPGFGKGGEDWFGFVYRIDAFEGEPRTENEEGTLLWTPVQSLLDGSLNLWPGDAHFLPLVFDADNRPFHGVMPYRDGHPVSWSYTR